MKDITIKKTHYKGFIITTKQVDSFCSLIYKGKAFIKGVVAEISRDNKASLDKAKIYIDNLISNQSIIMEHFKLTSPKTKVIYTFNNVNAALVKVLLLDAGVLTELEYYSFTDMICKIYGNP